MKKRIIDFFLRIIKRKREQGALLRNISRSSIKERARIKKSLSKPIEVVFVCHEPSLWSMFESVYWAMKADPGYDPVVVALPYKHSSLPKGQFKNAGMYQFCIERDISVLEGVDEHSREWVDPLALMPDYFFLQTPYQLYHDKWSAKNLSTIGGICYVPYATSLFKGKVDEILHPAAFFKYVHLVFKEGCVTKELFQNKFQNEPWFDSSILRISGHPKLDYLSRSKDLAHGAWKRPFSEGIKRILWTPRWNTSEGVCHFFEYRKTLSVFCEENSFVDFTFRPHPLCFQNFIKSGELTQSELDKLLMEYSDSENMLIDDSVAYHETFLSCDILVSDVSSMMLEFFVTGKPIIYTHRNNLFNEYGQALAEGFYWVENDTELQETLNKLIAGEDPLAEKRKELLKRIVSMPDGGAGEFIKDAVQNDFFHGID